MKIKQAIYSYLPNSIYYCKYYFKILRDLKEKETMDDKQIKEWQLKKINEELIYANKYVPYYKKLFYENNIVLPLNKLEDIKKIPYLTKDIIRKNYEALKSRENISKRVVNTGGSTGTPLRLEKTVFTLTREQVFLDYYMQKLKLKSFKCKKAIIRGSIPLKGISERTGNQLILSSYLISEKTIRDYIKALEQFNPTILHVYPSSIYMISKLIFENNLNIRIPGLKLILSSSEIFNNKQKEIVYNVFKCKIFDLYGNTENSVHGVNLYPNFGYKFNPFYSYVELDDEQIVTTTFDEKAMPLIRYKTGDEVEFIDKKNFIIKGRTQDYIYGNNETKYPVVGLIFGQHFSFFKDIARFQIIQNRIGKIHFVIESSYKVDNLKEEEIIRTIRNATAYNLEVEINYVDKIERTNRGKYKFLVQNINNLE